MERDTGGRAIRVVARPGSEMCMERGGRWQSSNDDRSTDDRRAVYGDARCPRQAVRTGQGGVGRDARAPVVHHMHRLVMAIVRSARCTSLLEHDLGEVFGDGLGYLLASRCRIRCASPMLRSLPAERIPGRGLPERMLAICARSRGRGRFPRMIRPKMSMTRLHEYLEAGTRLVWVLWPNVAP